jgi:hypothetical protein
MSHTTAPRFRHILHEAAMGNGDGSDGMWVQIITKHGPWAAGCIALCTVFYTFTLQPMSKERAMFAEALKQSVVENTQSWKAIAASTEKIAESVMMQQSTMAQMQIIVEDLNENMPSIETRKKLVGFVDEMLASHPEHTAMLEKILDLLENGH